MVVIANFEDMTLYKRFDYKVVNNAQQRTNEEELYPNLNQVIMKIIINLKFIHLKILDKRLYFFMLGSEFSCEQCLSRKYCDFSS